MKHLLLATALIFLTVVNASEVVAESRYVINKVPIPVRAGNCADCKILQWGITAGLEVEVIGESGDWTQVRTPGGVTGWMETQYLTTTKSLDETEQAYLGEIDLLQTQYLALSNQVNALIGQIDPATAETLDLSDPQQLEVEMDRLIRRAQEAITLGRQNEELLTRNQNLQSELDLMRADNDRLRDESWKTWFAYGGLAVAGGLILGMLVQMVTRRRKKNFNEWA